MCSKTGEIGRTMDMTETMRADRHMRKDSDGYMTDVTAVILMPSL